jgi:hypothetical protein
VKRCSKCRELKALDQFYAEKTCRDGVRPDCKSCFAARAKARYEAKRDDIIAYVSQWQKDNPERVRAYRKQYNASRKSELREGHLKRKFGITLADFEAMLAAQGGGCAICGRPAPEGTSLHVDHDHETGVVRGLLCFTCNGALGMLTENEEHLARAADYVSSGGFVASGATELVAIARERALALVGGGAGDTAN